MSLPTAKQRRRSNLWGGLILVAAGMWMVAEGVNVHRSGVYTSRHRTMEWWQEIPVGVGAILVGGLLAWDKKLLPK